MGPRGGPAFWKIEKSLAPVGIRNLARTSRTFVTIPTRDSGHHHPWKVALTTELLGDSRRVTLFVWLMRHASICPYLLTDLICNCTHRYRVPGLTSLQLFRFSYLNRACDGWIAHSVESPFLS